MYGLSFEHFCGARNPCVLGVGDMLFCVLRDVVGCLWASLVMMYRYAFSDRIVMPVVGLVI